MGRIQVISLCPGVFRKFSMHEVKSLTRVGRGPTWGIEMQAPPSTSVSSTETRMVTNERT